MRYLRLGFAIVLAAITLVFGVGGGYTWMYADHFGSAYFYVRTYPESYDLPMQARAMMYSHWRNLGYLYLAIATVAGILAHWLWYGRPPYIHRLRGRVANYIHDLRVRLADRIDNGKGWRYVVAAKLRGYGSPIIWTMPEDDLARWFRESNASKSNG